MPDSKIWIFYSNTGGGHRSAAQAIEVALREEIANMAQRSEIEIVMDSVAEHSHPINKFFVGLYNYLLRHKQSWMKYYYSFLNATKPNDSELGYRLIRPFLNKLLTRDVPTVIVSVHPMLNHYLARNRRELGLTETVRLLEVVTDPNADLWKGWACQEMDLIMVPNDLARNRLIEFGVQPERIRIIGMPINPLFLKPSTRSRVDFFREVGLSPDRLTVCVNAGWAGGGNMRLIYQQLQNVNRQFQVLFLCGHNDGLFAQMQKDAANASVPTAVLPFHSCMVDVMSHCDMMVSKAGGLTTFEAIAKRLPLAFDMLTEPMPQERGTIDLLLKEGLCQAVRKPEDIVPIVQSLNPLPDRETRSLPVAHSLDKTGAVYEMSRIILSACQPSFDLVCDTIPTVPSEGLREAIPLWEGI